MMKKTKWEDIAMKNAEQIVKSLGLSPLEGEGGMYLVTYNSDSV